MGKMRNRRNKKTKKEQIKRLFIEIIARLIYYTITTIFCVACILLFFGTLGAIVELCTVSKIYCICFIIVCGCIITKWTLQEIG